MTESAVVHTALSESDKAGAFLGSEISKSFHGQPPHALIVFASSKYSYAPLLKAIEGACGARIIVGCSSAGEFINGTQGEGSACAVALRSPEMHFAAGIGKQLRLDRKAAARQVVSSFAGPGSHDYMFRSALVLTDALAGYTDDLVEQLNLLTAGTYSLFGGGAGDDAKFSQTHVFYGTEAYPDAVVALEILSNKPLGVGVSHGWEPASAPLRVTEAEGSRLISLNASPAVEAFQDQAENTGQQFDPEDPLPFFLHNVIGIDTGQGHKLRVPLAVNPDGSISCASDIPTGVTVHIMRATDSSAAEAASKAIRSALHKLNGNKPKVALFFDCVATRLRMGNKFGLEMQSLQNTLGSTMYAGCNTYGQIARAEGQFSGFHNCTATVCVIPE
ncbi:MAG: FIST signal transduction protein [Acidobacteriota bacterium]